jgi:peroxiredoxin
MLLKIKYPLILALLFLSTVVLAQSTHFTIRGKIASTSKSVKAYLNYYVGYRHISDSASVKNGAFTFNGVINDPVQGFITLKSPGNSHGVKEDFVDLYIEKGIIMVHSTRDSISTATVSGTPSNDEHEILKEMLKGVEVSYEMLTEKKKLLVPGSPGYTKKKVALDSLVDINEKQFQQVKINYIQQYPQSFISLLQLIDLSYTNLDISLLERLFENLSAGLKTSATGKTLEKKLINSKGLSPGSTAPDFTLPDSSGNMVSLASFRGKYVLLDFWASWCVPCRQENPNIIKAYKAYQNKNFTVISVSLDSDKARWLAAVKADNLTWTQLSDLKSFKSKAAGLYNITGIPQNVLIDPDGKIVGRNIKGVELQQLLAKIL